MFNHSIQKFKVSVGTKFTTLFKHLLQTFIDYLNESIPLEFIRIKSSLTIKKCYTSELFPVIETLNKRLFICSLKIVVLFFYKKCVMLELFESN